MNPFGGNQLTLLGYDQEDVGEWVYYDLREQLPEDSFAWVLLDQTEVLLGFRFAAFDGVHFGWMRFSRPDTNFTTAFDLSAHDWNPIPGEPIGAGLPPRIPLVSEWTDDGLHLRWPVAVADWTLEFTDTLRPEGDWQPVPEAGGTGVILPPSESQRFFRLRRP
ncbi:MAG: hypothetical protein KF791_02060 [Verrucomicrobiae bacterium]|nr:hypothetical protein [Verrucomicrobiae bacterium]